MKIIIKYIYSVHKGRHIILNMFIPDENIKDVAIEECSHETKDGIVDPTPSWTSSRKILPE